MKTKKAFTLFELLVSISIIAILTAIAVVSYSKAQIKARDARRIQDVDAVSKSLEQYYSDNNFYPTDLNALDDLIPDYIQQLPSAIKDGYDFSYALNVSQSCYCSKVEEISRGNSTDVICTLGAGNTGGYYCRKGQQE